MGNESIQPGHPFRRAAQYLLTIIVILLVGKLVSSIPVMSRLNLLGSLDVAETVWFGSKLAALVLFFIFARNLAFALPSENGGFMFLRGIAEPVTVLIIIIFGQELVWEVLDRFVRRTGETIYFSLVAVLIIAASIWLLFKVYQYSLYLIEFGNSVIKLLNRFIPGRFRNCPACGMEIAVSQAYCGHCGHRMEEIQACSTCGSRLEEGQKFCSHCGQAVDPGQA